jgi:hypothetical protein
VACYKLWWLVADQVGGLGKALNLSEAEKIELSFAYTFERRAGEVRA